MKKKYLFFFLLFSFFSVKLFSQFKAVKIKSEDIYINFFYKKKQTKYIKNDSTYYLCKTVTASIFLLEKYLNNKRIWQFKYKAVRASDSLNVRELRRDSTGEHKIYYIKQPYYIGIYLKK